MTYKEARVYLDEVSKYGSVLGLDTIHSLMEELENPQEDLQFLHIAGTNGKGSVLAVLSTVLGKAGYRVGRYISPTVVSYLERIQVDGKWISEEEFTELIEEVQKAIARMETKGQGSPTVFEIETAAAFLYFKKKQCDCVVLETGLGGTLDATNIVKNTKAAIFTDISRDHIGILGNTLSEIAENKAGIIKSGCVVVSAEQREEVCDVLTRRAEEKKCPICFVDTKKIEVQEESYREQTFSYKGQEHLKIMLAGKYQLRNAALALEVLYTLRKEFPVSFDRITEKAIREGLLKTRWTGRFTCLNEDPVFVVDGAHNEDAARQLRRSVEIYFPGKRLICIFGVFKDKEYRKIAEYMIPYAKCVYTVDLPDASRTLPAEELKTAVEEVFCKMGRYENRCPVYAVGDIRKAVALAWKKAEKEDVILAFGSLSYLGKVIETVEEYKNNGKGGI